MAPPVSALYFCLWVCLVMVTEQATINEYNIVANPNTINAPSTHTWSFNYSSNAIRSRFTFTYPSCFILPTTPTINDMQVPTNIIDYDISSIANTISFTIPTPISRRDYRF